MTAHRRTLTITGRWLERLFVIRCYVNGSSEGFVWRWWNPIAWLAAPLLFAANCALAGIPESWRFRHHLGFGVDPYFIRSGKKVEWL